MLRRLFKCIREYKRACVLGPLFSIIEVALEVLIPFLMSKMIDNGINRGEISYIMKMGILLILCSGVSIIFGVLGGRYGAFASAGFAKNLRQDMFHNVQNFSFGNIDKFSTSGLVTRLTTDVTNLQNAFLMIIRVAVRAPSMLIFSLIMAFGINARLAMIFLCALPFLAVGLYIIASRAHPIFKKVFRIYDKLNRVIQENLRGIRVVKSFVREDYEIKKFTGVSEDIYRYFTRAERILAFNMPMMQFAIYLCLICISWFGARMIVGGNLTTGQLMSLISYAIHCLISLMFLSHVFIMAIISRASAERIAEVLGEESTLQDPENPATEVSDGSIIFREVGFSYAGDAEKECLKNVNLEIKSGETVGIIGGTGSAKTTLIQLIPRLYDVTEGEVLVGGVDVRDYSMHALRDQVAVVLQKNELFSGTIKENLRWGDSDATDEELIRVSKLAQADSFIREFPEGYDTFIEQGGSNVSGGQKQRLCIARALLKRPKILILDDSTSAVDTRTDALIRHSFLEEIPDTTKIIIAQRISSVEQADKIIVMDNGEIDAIGTHGELITENDIYREVYTSQMKGGSEDV